MTPERIAEIRASLAATTPGPWQVVPPLCGPDGQGIYTADLGCICEVGDPYPRGDNHPQENMEFIRAAHDEYVPELLAALEAAERNAARYRLALLAVQQVGHNDDCLFCGFKDRAAKAPVEVTA